MWMVVIGQGEGTLALGEKAAMKLVGMQMQRQVYFYAWVWRFQRPGMIFCSQRKVGMQRRRIFLLMPVCEDSSKVGFLFLHQGRGVCTPSQAGFLGYDSGVR
jgi:hypothetical protein